ncbi:MAG: SpoIIE family protein phosphatase [Anaerolineae bacterium]|nr:MAG: GAF sensor-containing protein serine phosphatase [Chloroflexi bacterium OLB13]MBW7879730.1 SpoIIE family protein phosphatase [Anaerolineae bacterium]MCO6445459.1 SpoIIE family protein phosphatase [Anaerolineae bacterium]MEB2365716.1 SpoIIE family protein phosphatase [Chloroflexota bacterium]
MSEALNLSPDHLAVIYRVSGMMNSSLDFDTALENIMGAVMTVVNAERGFMLRVDEATGEPSVLVARGPTNDTEGYSTTIVNQVIKTRQPMLTNNAQFDDRYQPGQSIIIRGLRAILCAPLLIKDRLIGVIYVDTSMRAGNFTPGDRDLLGAVAAHAAIALENARLYSLAVEQGRLMRELQMAREIQESLLPQHMPQMPGYEIAAHWESAREVAGDFYDVFALGDDHFAVVIADVSDKGAPAALFMAVARTMIRTMAHAGSTALDTLSHTNDLILEDAESGMFVTVYFSMYRTGGMVEHVNAGHNPSILYRHNEKRAFLLPQGGRAIGWFPDNPLRRDEIRMQPGDICVYYTDGVSEASNRADQMYGEERLIAALQRNAHLPADQILSAILKDVDAFCEDVDPFDDQTLVVVRFTG